MHTVKRNAVPLLASLLAVLCMVGVSFADFGAAQGGSGSGGFANPATADLDMANNDITGVDDLTVDASTAIDMSVAGTTAIYADTNLSSLTAPSGGVARLSAGGVQFDVAATGVAITGDAAISGVTSATVALPVQEWKAATKSLTDAECRGQVWGLSDGTGTTYTLPAAPTRGAHVTFVHDGSGLLRIDGNGLDIRTPAFSATSYVSSSRVGSVLHLVLTMNGGAVSGEWTAVEATGTWRNGSTTSAGFAFTPTARTTYSPTATWTGPNITTTGYYVHDGATCHVSARVEMAGDATGGTFLAVSLPLAIDETAMALTTAYASVGGFSYFDSGTAHYSYPVIIIASSNNAYAKTNVTGGDTFFSRGGSPVTPANNDRALFTFSYAVTQ
jgi:hypothetical protein